jgi:hypothetical protein
MAKFPWVVIGSVYSDRAAIAVVVAGFDAVHAAMVRMAAIAATGTVTPQSA